MAPATVPSQRAESKEHAPTKNSSNALGPVASNGPPTVSSLTGSRQVLHTGDVVLLQCQLHEQEVYAEVGETIENQGFVRACGIQGLLEVVRVTDSNFHKAHLDVRDFLYVVVDQLAYTAQRELHQRRKLLAKKGGHVGSSAMAQMRVYEERAEEEASKNREKRKKRRVPVLYGDVIQLQHLRTGRFIDVHGKRPALLQPTSRRTSLNQGTLRSWLRVNPLFKHRMQGEAVTLNEQVTLESIKMGEQWNLNWAKCVDGMGKEVYEVNCCRKGRGWYFALYSRAVDLEPGLGLGFSSAILLYHPHYAGYVCSSSSRKKATPKLRRGQLDSKRNAKDLWVIELPAMDFKECGIEYGATPVLLRHFGSGQYLAISEKELLDRTFITIQELQDVYETEGFNSRPMRPSQLINPAGAPSSLQDGADYIGAELVDFPGPLCLFVLEKATPVEVGMNTRGNTNLAPQDNCCVMIRWNHPTKENPFYLSCIGQPTSASQKSLKLQWSELRYSRDALNVIVVDDESWVLDCDTVQEHTQYVQKSLLEHCRQMDSQPGRALVVRDRVSRAVKDLIFWIMGSGKWRNDKVDLADVDIFKEPWLAQASRQRLLRELRCVDTTMELYHELAQRVPSLSEGMVKYAARVEHMHVRTCGRNHAFETRTIAIKLLVRFWLYCFAHSKDAADQFFHNGWVKVIDNLNGHGLGASEVFVAMMHENMSVVRQLPKSTITKFIGYIRVLGPEATWMQFLKAVCYPEGATMSVKQQEVLSQLYFAGYYASEVERATAQNNKEDLLVWVRLDQPLGVPLTPPRMPCSPKGGRPPLEDCIAQDLLVDGLRDIVVSWKHPHTWVVGDGVLFHGPAALSLPELSRRDALDHRVWVPLVQIVWVLQPETCCERVTGMSWDEAQKNDVQLQSGEYGTSRIDLLRKLAQYFLAQLQLVSLMARERQMNCIMALQEEYSISLCLSGASDKRLPNCVRAAFYDLVVDMWVDRHPHSLLIMPVLMRTAEEETKPDTVPSFRLDAEEEPGHWNQQHCDSLPDFVRQFYRASSPWKMEAVVQSLRSVLSVGRSVEQQAHDNKDGTALLLASIRLLACLLRFGFLPSLRDQREILAVVMRCLDGRTDWIETRQMTDSVLTMEASLDDGTFGNGGLTNESRTPLLAETRSQERRERPRSSALGGYPPKADGLQRYVKCDENKFIMRGKAHMLDVVLQVQKVANNTQISRATNIINRYARDLPIGTAHGVPEILIEDLFQILDTPPITFVVEQLYNPSAMCIDLMMYDDPDIFRLALELLASETTRCAEFMQTIEKVVLLSPVQSIVAKELQADVALLGKLLYNSETWVVGDNFSSGDSAGSAASVQRVCLKLRNLCNLGDAASTPQEIQDMLRQTHFVSLVEYCLTLDSEDFSPGSKPLLSKFLAQVCSVATQFVRNNHKNQELMHALVPAATSRLADQPICALLIAETFRGNFELCQRVTPDLISKFGALVKRERVEGRFVPWYLSFFGAILKVGAKSIVRNQQMVIEELRRLGPGSALHLLADPAGQERLARLASTFSSAGQLRDPEVSRWSSGDDELIYYVRCVEVLEGLAFGRGSQNLITRPFVSMSFPVEIVLQLLLKTVSAVRQRTTSVQFSIYRLLRLRWLQLVHHLAYDVDTNLVDIDLLTSSLHIEFFTHMMDWLLALLQPNTPALQGAPTSRASGSNQPQRFSAIETPLLTEDDEDFLQALLHCVDCFYGVVYPVINNVSRCAALRSSAAGAATRLKNLVNGHSTLYVGLRDAELLQMALHRVTAATGGEVTLMVPAAGTHIAKEGENLQTPAQVFLQSVVQVMQQHPSVQERIQYDAERLGQVFLSILEATDPQNADYVSKEAACTTGSLPPGTDFRRNAISTEDVLKRMVAHVNAQFRDDVPTIRRCFQALSSMFMRANSSPDTSVLKEFQHLCVRSGVMDMIVRVLDARLTDELTLKGWKLIVDSLTLGANHQVNRAVQKGIYAGLRSGDDSGMWESFHDLVRGLGMKDKRIRGLRLMKSLGADQREELAEFDIQLSHAMSVMEAARLMVEGHYFPMQQYLFIQEGNERSCNVVEIAGWLLSRLCKDPAATDTASDLEIECVDCTLKLLTELMQGPNLRNQEYLSTLGMIETLFKTLSARFHRLLQEAQDCYPRSVRLIKADLTQTLLSLLEGRLDTKLHKTMLQRVDRHVIRIRLEHVYLYFVFGCVGVASGKVQVAASSGPTAAVPLNSRTHALMDASMDTVATHERMMKDREVAEEILEDFEDQELHELLGEGLNLLQLILQLAQLSPEFAKDVMPVNEENETFEESMAGYATEAQYQADLVKYLRRDIYRAAYTFMYRFVKTIEVILDGNLQSLLFRQPLTAMWYVAGHAKNRILEQVDLSTPDIKAKSFVRMCMEVHRESLLIRRLSRFSILPERYRKWAQRHLPDGVHRPFQVFLSHDARWMQQLLRISLYLSLALGAHVGIFLIPMANGRRNQNTWATPLMGQIAFYMGFLHWLCTLVWLLITACIKIPLKISEAASDEEKALQWAQAQKESVSKEWKSGPKPAQVNERARFGKFIHTFFVGMSAMLSDGYTLWRCVLLVGCFVALVTEHIWLFGLLPVDLFCQSPQLTTVLVGVTAKGKALCMTFLGATVLTFVYAAIGFHYFREDFGEQCNQNILTCLGNMLYQGTRAGAVGISGMMRTVLPDDPTWLGRFWFDVSYFVILDIMILNTIVGLIVDSFSAQRSAAEARAYTLETQTFISCIHQRTIESVAQTAGMSNGFEYHEEHKQNKWDYMSFIFHLREKNIQDFTGPEQQIRSMIDKRDIKWMPLQRSMMLEDSGGKTERESIEERIEHAVLDIKREQSQARNSDRLLHKRLTSTKKAIDERLEALQQVASQGFFARRSPPSGSARRNSMSVVGMGPR